MVVALLYSVVRRYSIPWLIATELQLELLVVRHQLRVLQRQVKRPPWRPADRFLLVGLSQRLPRSAWPSFLITPDLTSLAPGTRPPQMGAICSPFTPRPAATPRRSGDARRSPGPRESALGSATHPGRIAEARPRPDLTRASVVPYVGMGSRQYPNALAVPGEPSSASTPIKFSPSTFSPWRHSGSIAYTSCSSSNAAPAASIWLAAAPIPPPNG